MAAVLLTFCAAAAPRSWPPPRCLDGLGLPSDDAPLRLDGGMTRPRLVRRVAPDLPNGPQRVEGVILIETIIDRKGRICDARLVKGSGPLADSLLAAVKQWEFEPARKNGKPVAVFFTLAMNVCPR